MLACKSASVREPAIFAESVVNADTQVARTWSAIETVSALSATPSPTQGPSSTPAPPTETPTLTRTPTVTETPIPPLTALPTFTPAPTQPKLTPIPTYPPSGGGTGSGGGSGSGGGGGSTPPCYEAELIMDITMPEGAILPPSTAFTKIWRIRNVGFCNWDTSFAFVFIDGDRMEGRDIHLPNRVRRGATVDIAIPMISPALQGGYAGEWMFQVDRQQIFGWGPESERPFTVDINVAVVSSGVLYNFANRMCTATWSTSTNDRLRCPTRRGNTSGFVVRENQPNTEAGVIGQSSIWSHPHMVPGGWISGTFPGLLIQSNDHFTADVGCMNDFPGCNVTFRLYSQIYGADPQLLGEWNEVHDGSLTHIDVSLSGLAGQTASLILYALGNGPQDQNAAVWIAPQLVRP